MFRTFVVTTALTVLTPLAAQQNLDELQQRFAQEARALGDRPSRADIDGLRARQIAALQRFVDGAATGADAANGRLMLADFQLASGEREAAVATLQKLDADSAPGLVLVTAAAMAQHLGLDDLRATFVQKGADKPAPRADRMAMARLLMTVLHEIDRAAAIYEQELGEADDDEERALVRWHRADAMRDREDLPDNAGFEELQRLADDLPGTYWGAVAKDRLRATTLRPGDAGIPFRVRTRAGKEIASDDLRGKAVVLLFWSGADRDLPRLLETLRPLQQRHGDKLFVLGINLDRDAEQIGRDQERLGLDFPIVGDGKGIEQDLPLRWFVEGPQVHVLDAAGKVVGLGLHAGTADGRAELIEVIGRAVPK